MRGHIILTSKWRPALNLFSICDFPFETSSVVLDCCALIKSTHRAIRYIHEYLDKGQEQLCQTQL